MTIVALLTDFGTRDPYVAAMKGVIAARCDARIEDLSHDIAPFDVFGAAWFLRNVVDYWPPETIFVAVVDPGVGTARRIIAAHCGDHFFLAPDNGVLSLVVTPPVVSVENDAFFLANGSTTFHGRDRFAPVAAAIANGTAVSELGPKVDAVVRFDYTPPAYGGARIEGTVVGVDRFGNLITDIEAARIGFAAFTLRSGWHVVDRVELNYGDAAAATPFMIVGSSGCIELSVAKGSAADVLQLSRGDRVSITPRL
ncbi:MAG TPA: SAM-dependent chlorinase/fluorinase [Thermoanaerobaculia bacterium]|nr:SAM-dependent chlorinase/fluorinase [Thermoanaerobaculia bacterium]